MIQHSLLSAAGQALYGKKWKRDVAKLCHVHEKTVARWADGTSPVPWWAFSRLQEECPARIAELQTLHDELRTCTLGEKP